MRLDLRKNVYGTNGFSRIGTWTKAGNEVKKRYNEAYEFFEKLENMCTHKS